MFIIKYQQNNSPFYSKIVAVSNSLDDVHKVLSQEFDLFAKDHDFEAKGIKDCLVEWDLQPVLEVNDLEKTNPHGVCWNVYCVPDTTMFEFQDNDPKLIATYTINAPRPMVLVNPVMFLVQRYGRSHVKESALCSSGAGVNELLEKALKDYTKDQDAPKSIVKIEPFNFKKYDPKCTRDDVWLVYQLPSAPATFDLNKVEPIAFYSIQ